MTAPFSFIPAVGVVELSGVDWLLVGIIGILCLRGIFKGFVYQAARIAAIILGFILAAAFSGPVAAWLREALPNVAPPWDEYLSYGVIFVGTWGSLTLLAHYLKKKLEKEKLTFLDRLWGGVLGGLKACLLIVVAVFALSVIPGGTFVAGGLRDSKVLPTVYSVMQNLTFLFPESVMESGREVFEMPDAVKPEGTRKEPEPPPADTTDVPANEKEEGDGA